MCSRNKKYVVSYGSNNIFYSGHAEIDVVDVKRPPKCNPEKRIDNIALLILSKPIIPCTSCLDIAFLEVQVLPIDEDATYEVFGFGNINQPCFKGDKTSTIMRKTEMQILSNKKCKKSMENGSNKETLLCTRPVDFLSTLCSGDEGGVLVDPVYRIAIGVVNFVDPYCGLGSSTVFTSIRYFAMKKNKNMAY